MSTTEVFTLTESGRAKLAALGIHVAPEDERRAGWQPRAVEGSSLAEDFSGEDGDDR